MRASDYASHIRGIATDLVRQGMLTRQSRPITVHIDSGNTREFILADRPGLIYQDGAFLRISEEFQIDEHGGLQRKHYAYHYERAGGYYIRFEREQHEGDQLYKPEYHMHVCWRLPHFPSPSITLAELFDFINVNFYNPDHRQRLVGHHLAIEI